MSTLLNRNVIASRGRTSIRLEPEFWTALEEIARAEGVRTGDLVRRAERQGVGLTAAVRVFLLGWFRDRAGVTPMTPAEALEADLDLLRVCGKAQAIDARFDATCAAIRHLPKHDPQRGPAEADIRLLATDFKVAVACAAGLPARTGEGLRAKASLLLAHVRFDAGTLDLARSLARDVAGRVAA